MSPVGINGVDHQSVALNGVQIRQALNPANEIVAEGVYDPTTLSAVDADLAVANIREATTIFGFLGTLVPGGAETIEMNSTATLGLAATYTPADSGIFFTTQSQYEPQYQSTGGWVSPRAQVRAAGFTAIGDGSHFRIKCGIAATEYIIFRHHYGTGTYERARDEQLAAGADWIPAVSGFFATGGEDDTVQVQVNKPVAGWMLAGEWQSALVVPGTIYISDGARLKVKNTHGVNAYWHATMRAIMTS